MCHGLIYNCIHCILLWQPLPSLFNFQTAVSLNAEASRADFLKQASSAAAGLAFFASATPANAAKYGSVGKGSPLVLDPKTAEIDKEILETAAVQKSFSNLKQYAAAAKSIKTVLQKNSQANVGPEVRKYFDFSRLRGDLNTVNTIFDEDTQKGTDRLIRNILQDITELEATSNIKEGIPRSEIRLNKMIGKCDKLARAFDDYLAFAPK